MAAFGWDDLSTTDDGPRHSGPSIEEIKARVNIKDYADSVLEHTRRGELVCPVCGSGAGPDKSPAFTLYPDSGKWHCFSGNHPANVTNDGDILDLAGIVNGTDDKREQIRIVCEWAGIDPGTQAPSTGRKTASGTAGSRKAAKARETAPRPADEGTAEGRERNRVHIGKCFNAMGGEGLEYARSRGFTDEEIIDYRLGWDAARKRLVIPWSADAGEYYHIDRDVTDKQKNKYTVPGSAETGGKRPYNLQALENPVVWVVEGLFDAMSVNVCGGHAIACVGTAYGAAKDAIVARKYKGIVVCALDRDGAGRENNASLLAELQAANVAAIADDEADGGEGLPFGAKDANEVLVKDRAALTEYVARVNAAAEAKAAELREEAYRKARKALRMIDPYETMCRIWSLEDWSEPVSTGIAGIDKALDGGLYKGLYTLGAISSFGKTTLLVQMGDAIAESGRPVLFVTVEQSAAELARKSISRRMWEISGGTVEGTVSTRNLARPTERERWSNERHGIFRQACEWYTQVALYLQHQEGVKQPGVADISAAAALMADHFGQAPVIFIDYLQLLAPVNVRDTDKQAVDRNMMLLRQLSRDMDTTVLTVSSLNRSSYSGVIDLDSFKESGGIEYGSDVLLGLQPYGIREKLKGLTKDKKEREADELISDCKAGTVRDVELVVLKQREGLVGGEADLRLHCIPSAFVDMQADEPTPAKRKKHYI